MADKNTFVLFEEIKNKLETIYRELKELKEKENCSVSPPVPSTPVQRDEQQEQELLNQYEQRIKELINKYIGVQVRIKDEETKSIDKLAASVLISLVGNYFLWQSKQQYKDDALKFRIIRVWKGCSPKEILWLNDVFDIHRNEKTIKLIKGKADGYDMELKQKADSLIQNKMK